MNVEQLLEKYKGEKVAGRARIRIGKTVKVIGRLVDGVYELTEEGRKFVKTEGAEDAEIIEETPAPKPKRKRRSKAEIEAEKEADELSELVGLE